MNIDKKFLRTIESIKEEGKELFEKVVEFVKEHKKLILIGVIGYVVWKYLFDEENDNDW